MLALLLLACDSAVFDSADSAADASPVTVSEVAWSVDWDTAGVQAEAGGGWRLTNNLGQQVLVEQGWLVSYSAALVPCATARLAPRPGVVGALLGVAVARAGHGEEADPSSSPVAVVEDLADPQGSVLAEVSFDAAAYCGVHYLVGQAPEDTVSPDGAPDMQGVSLVLEGWWWPAGGGDAQPLSLRSSLAWGNLMDLAEVGRAGAGERAEVRLTRRLAGLFDGVDLAAEDGQSVAYGVLGNLVGGTSAALTLVEVGD